MKKLLSRLSFQKSKISPYFETTLEAQIQFDLKREKIINGEKVALENVPLILQSLCEYFKENECNFKSNYSAKDARNF